MRTENYDCFLENDCVSDQSIVIASRPNLKAIDIDDDALYWRSPSHEFGRKWIELLAKNDGFDSVEDFFKWFSSDFQGKIIHWTDFQY